MSLSKDASSLQRLRISCLSSVQDHSKLRTDWELKSRNGLAKDTDVVFCHKFNKEEPHYHILSIGSLLLVK
ncbi:hypothetical protein Y1Q_0014509 [Alligator mississippiensis]|uniref:Uncharacterized protein n=1 Tax=Alligator mississippiensis TaxID=8496 RepID=A0A151PDU6_ALLMI|nr:hypothetical protein Y1Q_0014509 [Alligator mississippiensis]